MNVVIVESPAKAKTINKYLGPDYRVVASYGHVRDLPSKDGSVLPDEGFAMKWETDPKAERHIKEIATALKGAERLFLATDPDREGEAISWHVYEVLKRRNALKGVDVSRVVFNEVTRDAVLDAMRHPRPLNRELVDAYLARRALDYLVGFTLSPVLWRKLPGSRSAGRVQSVALRLICEREGEIEAFRPREYWTVDAAFRTAAEAPFSAHLSRLDGHKLDKFSIADKAAAEAAVQRIATQAFTVAAIERKQTRRHPQPPFTTSTLQQEASRKLGMGASRTMRTAQRLYEGIDIGGETVGLITYMRTDSVHLAREAIAGCRGLIADKFGERYLPKAPRVFRQKAKNAQEAHEAIRPTDLTRMPKDLAQRLDRDQYRLYELVWKRAIASQMESTVLEQVGVDIASEDAKVGLRATGTQVVFDGFLRLYQEGRDEAEAEAGEKLLPPVAEGEALTLAEVTPEQHFTQPPPRYSEASLVKRLEELGIGRPSTYASILQVLQDREYVLLDKRRFIPEDRGRVVTAFLTNFFERYVQYNFTAEMEDLLDEVSNGRVEWKTVLNDFWGDFIHAVNGTKDLTIRQVLDALDEDLGAHFFPDEGTGADPRACPTCEGGRLGLKLGKFGAFLGCSNYPECKYTRPLALKADGEAAGTEATDYPKELGTDPESGLAVSVRKGPYGFYVQLGEGVKATKATKGAKAIKGVKPKRASLPKGVAADSVDLKTALGFLSLPREIGTHPESGKLILAGIGRFGPYLKHDDAYVSLPAGDDVLTVGINRAVDLLKEAKTRKRPPAREIGPHPADSKPVTLHSGRYGPYVAHGKLRASLPRGRTGEDITLEEAVALLAAKASGGNGKKAPAKKTVDKKVTGKKATKAPKAKAPKAPKAKTAKTAAATTVSD